MTTKPSPDKTAAPDADTGPVRIRMWQQFKQLVVEKKPGSIVYILEQNGFTQDKEVTILRLIMLHAQRYFIFIHATGRRVEDPLPRRRHQILFEGAV